MDVPPGTTVKEAAEAAGIEVPGLCSLQGLTPYGGCRLCLVEVEGMRGYPSSCTLPAAEGMVVSTATPYILELRKAVLEMILSEHPNNCIVCQRVDGCEAVREGLRKVPQNMGCRYCPRDGTCELQRAAEVVGVEKMDLPRLGTTKDVIRSPFFDRDPNLCILCGRCVRACPNRVLAFINRGFEAAVGTAFERPLEESGCRFCGSCLDSCPTGALQERGNKWAGPADRTVTTTCPYCSSNCVLTLEMKGGRLLWSRPENGCVRGRFGLDFLGHRDRLRMPMVRKEGVLVKVGWVEAFEAVVEGLGGRAGPGFSLLTSGVCTNESLYVSSRFAREVMLGSAWAPDAVASTRMEVSGPTLLVGDLEETLPALERVLEPAVVVSPWRTRLAGAARVWLRPPVGGVAEVLADLARELDGRGTSRREIGEQELGEQEIDYTENYTENYTKRSGRGPCLDLGRAAEVLRGCTVLVEPGRSHRTLRAASLVASAAGGRLVILGENCNSRGAAALGLRPGLGLKGARAAYVVGCNPARRSPETVRLLEGLEFLVVQDLFLTETARLADVVLPAASSAEAGGTYTGANGDMLRLGEALPGLGRPDWDITAELARRLGFGGYDFRTSEEVGMKVSPLLRSAPALAFLEDVEGDCGDRADRRACGLIDGDLAYGRFLLQVLPSLYQFGTGTRTSRVPDLRYLCRRIRVEISPEDARVEGLMPGDDLVVESPLGRLKAVAVISNGVPPGALRARWDPALGEMFPGDGVFKVRLDVPDRE